MNEDKEINDYAKEMEDIRSTLVCEHLKILYSSVVLQAAIVIDKYISKDNEFYSPAKSLMQDPSFFKENVMTLASFYEKDWILYICHQEIRDMIYQLQYYSFDMKKNNLISNEDVDDLNVLINYSNIEKYEYNTMIETEVENYNAKHKNIYFLGQVLIENQTTFAAEAKKLEHECGVAFPWQELGMKQEKNDTFPKLFLKLIGYQWDYMLEEFNNPMSIALWQKEHCDFTDYVKQNFIDLKNNLDEEFKNNNLK